MKPGNLCALSLHMNLEDWEAEYSAQDVHDKVSAESKCVVDPAKWYKTIYALAAACEGSQSLLPPSQEDLHVLADRLQRSFIMPWSASIGQVKSVLEHLNPRKATVSDNAPAWCLKRFSEELAPVIHEIVSSSIDQSKYPASYKHALISPVPKIRPPTDIGNEFRQISVLPQLAKVLEKLQLKLNNPSLKIKRNQHAFTSVRSWYDATDNTMSGRKGTNALFLDFHKAFDLVTLSKLHLLSFIIHSNLKLVTFLQDLISPSPSWRRKDVKKRYKKTYVTNRSAV